MSLGWILPIKEVTRKRDPCCVWRNILLSDVLLSATIIPVLISGYRQASTLVRDRIMDLTRLGRRIEAVDLLWNGLDLRITGMA